MDVIKQQITYELKFNDFLENKENQYDETVSKRFLIQIKKWNSGYCMSVELQEVFYNEYNDVHGIKINKQFFKTIDYKNYYDFRTSPHQDTLSYCENSLQADVLKSLGLGQITGKSAEDMVYNLFNSLVLKRDNDLLSLQKRY
jgi:hypothetical protein